MKNHVNIRRIDDTAIASAETVSDFLGKMEYSIYMAT